MPLTVLSCLVPRESESTPEHMAQLLASLAKAAQKPGIFGRLLGRSPVSISLEITLLDNQISFAVVSPPSLDSFVQSQILATYPDVVMAPIADYLSDWSQTLPEVSLVKQRYAAYFPLRDYADYKEVDPMLPLLGILSKASPQEKILIQFILTTPSSRVIAQAQKYLHPAPHTSSDGKIIKDPPPEGKKLIDDKLSYPLVGVSIRFASTNSEIIKDLHGAVSVLDRPDGNSLVKATLLPWQKSKLWDKIRYRLPFTYPLPHINSSTLNVMELSSLWHLPGVYSKLPNIAWSVSKSLTEPPQNLPFFTKIASPSPDSVSPNDDVNFFASTTFKNQPTIFGTKLEDRLRHFYILGKSGTGKSTLLENMVIDDLKKGRGVAFIDPHGDSADNLLNYIPSHRINEVIYFNPSDRQYPICINILETTSPDQAELVTSGIVAIFHKIYGHSWGPRLEYILRNTVLSLAYIPGSTLPDVIKMLTDYKFRQKLYSRLSNYNPQLESFWKNEFDPLDDSTRLEHISPILNKVGQFVNSPLIHEIISHPKSSINFDQIINSGHILIANLSQGKLGEDNSALLGAMFITKIQLAAMNRISVPEKSRPDFFLYVDEFQNFATISFIKILSEARKFHLGLILANQYIAQIPEEIQSAIFGNAGTVAAFVLGADDAKIMAKEFGEVFTETSLVSLPKYQIALKMTIDGTTTLPFLATTLPPLKSTNKNRDKVITVSRDRWAKKIKSPELSTP